MLYRVIGILAIIIVGAYAAEMVVRVLAPVVPYAIVLLVLIALMGGYIKRKRKF